MVRLVLEIGSLDDEHASDMESLAQDAVNFGHVPVLRLLAPTGSWRPHACSFCQLVYSQGSSAIPMARVLSEEFGMRATDSCCGQPGKEPVHVVAASQKSSL